MTGSRRSLLGLAPLSGTIWVAAGSALLGASGYAFLTITARIVPPAGYAALASLYLLVALVGPALFIPIEQECTRLVSRWHALGLGTRAIAGQLARTAAAMTVLAAAGLAAAGPLLIRRVFAGQAWLLLALIASVLGYGGACLIRGIFAGQRRLGEYAVVVGVDGLVRLTGCVGLAVVAVASPVPYGVALGLGPVAALLAGLIWLRPAAAGPRVPWAELVPAVAWLAAAWGASFALANIAPVIVTALLPGDPARASVFAFAFVVARVPVFVLLSLQAILLPALSRAAATRDVPGLRRSVRQALLVVAMVGMVALVATAPVCQWLAGILFRQRGALSGWTLTALAVGTILAMAVQVLQPALIAIAGHRVVAGAWLAGAIAFAAAFLVPLDAVLEATVAQVLAGAITCAVMAVALQRHLRSADRAPIEVSA